MTNLKRLQLDIESISLLRRAVKQLNKWSETYGQWQPLWLPPAGDVELWEDIDAHIEAMREQDSALR